MHTRRFPIRPGLWMMLAIAMAAMLHHSPAQAAAVDEAQVQRIRAALPARASTQPAKPRKLLVFVRDSEGRNAQVIPHASAALRLLGQGTGAFEATVSEDIAAFEADNLKQFDAVCLANGAGELFLPNDLDKLPAEQQEQARQRDGRLKKGLADFIRGGKGLAAIHGALDAFPQWAEFHLMLGGGYDGTPWGTARRIKVRVEDPDHPLCAAFGGKDLELDETPLQVQAPYYRLFQRVLLTLDDKSLDMKAEGVHRTDNDLALSWVKREGRGGVSSQGRGRVFYTGLGGRPESWCNPQVLKHILDGLQYALGDLQVNVESIPSLNDCEMIRQAMPKPQAKPAKPRRLLVFARYGHTYGHYIAKALEIMGRDTGALEAVVSDDPMMFTPDKLRDFDAVFMNHSSVSSSTYTPVLSNKPDAAQAKSLAENLVQFVKDGKGIVGVHGSAGAGKELSELFGPGMVNHPWYQKVQIKMDDPASPLCRSLGEGFEVYDDIYAYPEPYPADFHTLLSVDLSKTVREVADNMKWLNDPGQQPARKDGHHAVSWIRSYGKGRAFYTSFGHHFSVVYNPKVLQHYLDGIQFAMGDLPADTTPNVKPPATQAASPK